MATKNPVIRPGNRGKSIQRAKVLTQRWLRSYKATALANRINEASMIYGPDAVKGVKYIQTKHGIPSTGVIDARTWKILEQKVIAPKKVRKPSVKYNGSKQGHSHGTQTPRVIVLHSTESHDYRGITDISGVLGYLSRTPDRLNCHLVVDKEGYTGIGGALNELMYHCAGNNTGSIGIEQIGFARFSLRTWRSRKAQLETVAKWLAYISDKYDIPLVHSTTHGVCMHKDVPAGGHHDPGKGYPFKQVLTRAKALKKTGW